MNNVGKWASAQTEPKAAGQYTDLLTVSFFPTCENSNGMY